MAWSSPTSEASSSSQCHDVQRGFHADAPTRPPSPDSNEAIIIVVSPWREPLKAGKLEARADVFHHGRQSTHRPPRLSYLKSPTERANYNLAKQGRNAIERAKEDRILLQNCGLLYETIETSYKDGVRLWPNCNKSESLENTAKIVSNDRAFVSAGSLPSDQNVTSSPPNDEPKVSSQLLSAADTGPEIFEPTPASANYRSGSRSTSISRPNALTADPTVNLAATCFEGLPPNRRSYGVFIADDDLRQISSEYQTTLKVVPISRMREGAQEPDFENCASARKEAIGIVAEPNIYLEECSGNRPLFQGRQPIWRLYPKVKERDKLHSRRTCKSIDHSLSNLKRLSHLAGFPYLDNLLSKASRSHSQYNQHSCSSSPKLTSNPHCDRDSLTPTTRSSLVGIEEQDEIRGSLVLDEDDDISVQVANERNWELAMRLSMSQADIKSWYMWLTSYCHGEMNDDIFSRPPRTHFSFIPAPVSRSEVKRVEIFKEASDLIIHAETLAREEGLNFYLTRLAKSLDCPPMICISLLTETDESIIASSGSCQALKDIRRLPRGVSLGFHAALVPHEQCYCVLDLSTHALFRNNPLVETLRIRSYFALPLIIGGHAVALLAIYDTSPAPLTKVEVIIHAMAETRRKIHPILLALRQRVQSPPLTDRYNLQTLSGIHIRAGENNLTSHEVNPIEPYGAGSSPDNSTSASRSVTLFQRVFGGKGWKKETVEEDEDMYADVLRQPLLAGTK